MTTPDSATWTTLTAALALPAGLDPVRWTFHEADQSIEVFLPPGLPTSWQPTADRLQAVCALGYLGAYLVFPDDTEVVATHRPDGSFAIGPRERVGTPRWAAGHATGGVTLRGDDLARFAALLRSGA